MSSEKMDCAAYRAERLADQLEWYDRKSAWNKRWHNALRVIEIGAAALVPFFVGFASDENAWAQVTVGLLGVIVTIVAGVLTLGKFHENWVSYRATAEALKREELLFRTEQGPYAGQEDAFGLLVARVETLLANEQRNWLQQNKTESKAQEG